MTRSTDRPTSIHAAEKQTFAFSPENQKAVDRIIGQYPPGRQASAVVPLLDLAQRQCGGWLPQAAIEAVAQLLNMPIIRTYEVATFYTMFNLKPVGKYHIQLCRTAPCWLRGSDDIAKVCESHLGIKSGEVTHDHKFSLTEVECLGACINAPVIQINDDYYENLTPESMEQILQNLAKGKPTSQMKKTTSKHPSATADEGEL